VYRPQAENKNKKLKRFVFVNGQLYQRVVLFGQFKGDTFKS
jgi:hypothetical protein